MSEMMKRSMSGSISVDQLPFLTEIAKGVDAFSRNQVGRAMIFVTERGIRLFRKSMNPLSVGRE